MKSLTITIGLALVIALSVVNASPVHACSCIVPGPPREELGQSSAVFTGTVLSIRPALLPLGTGKTVTFTVDKAWKGVTDKKLTVATAKHSAECGFPFIAGQQYLVYTRNEGGQRLSASLCSRTKELAQTQTDLDELGAPEHDFAALASGGQANDRGIASRLLLGFATIAVIVGGLFYLTRERKKTSAK